MNTKGNDKNKIQEFYRKQDPTFSPALSEEVCFAGQGWKHLTRKGNGQRRNKKDIDMRLDLIGWAPEVIKRAKTVSKTEVRSQVFRVGKLPVTYYELRHIFHRKGKEYPVAVILRRISDQAVHYYSIRYFEKKSKK
jgi:hypothetical protein